MKSVTFTTAALLAVACLVSSVPAIAGVDWITRQDLIDAILERGSYSAAELDDLDLDGDGRIDVKDLVCFNFECHREASFLTTTTIVEEDAGTVVIPLTLERATEATVTYSVSGSATADLDYAALSGTVPVSGTGGQIVLTILDDAIASEPVETLVLTLQTGAGYGLGATVEHRVQIVDNDATWIGALDSPAGAIPLRVDLVHDASGWSAELGRG